MALKPRCAGLETGGWRTASKRFKPSQRSRWPAACSRLVRGWSSSSRARAGFRTPLKRGCRGRHPEILSLYNTGEARMNQRRSSAIEALRAELLKRIKAGVEYIRLLQKECAVADRPLKFGFIFTGDPMAFQFRSNTAQHRINKKYQDQAGFTALELLVVLIIGLTIIAWGRAGLTGFLESPSSRKD